MFLPGIPILIGKDRYRTGRYAYEQFGAQVLILMMVFSIMRCSATWMLY
jgi:hypothetical protein